MHLCYPPEVTGSERTLKSDYLFLMEALPRVSWGVRAQTPGCSQLFCASVRSTHCPPSQPAPCDLPLCISGQHLASDENGPEVRWGQMRSVHRARDFQLAHNTDAHEKGNKSNESLILPCAAHCPKWLTRIITLTTLLWLLQSLCDPGGTGGRKKSPNPGLLVG